MINLSSTTAHYVDKSNGHGRGVGSMPIASDMEGLLGYGRGFPWYRQLSHNRLQYQIPTVGQHYGNAFHLAEDDGDEPLPLPVEHSVAVETLRGHVFVGTDGDDDVEDDDEDEDEDEDEDIGMSPAIEVISIDPNCDYDSGGEEVEEEDPSEAEDVNEIQIEAGSFATITEEVMVSQGEEDCGNNHGSASDLVNAILPKIDSIDEACATKYATTAGDDAAESVVNDRAKEEEHYESDCSSNSNGSNSSSSSSSSKNNDSDCSRGNHCTTSSHDSDYVQHSDGEAAATTAISASRCKSVYERRQQMAAERRKRTTSHRKSFSLPHSPVGVPDEYDMTSFSFEELDMQDVSKIVTELCPDKGTCARTTAEHDSLLVEELAEKNFDLAAYITGEESNASSSRVDNGRQKKCSRSSPIKRQLAPSRGKEINTLRQLMVSSPERNEVSEREGSTSRRRCTAKVRRIVENSDSDVDDDDDEDGARTMTLFGIERTTGKHKRKSDDTRADPTWNPSAKSSQRAGVNHKASTATNAQSPTSAEIVQQQKPQPEAANVKVKAQQGAIQPATKTPKPAVVSNPAKSVSKYDQPAKKPPQSTTKEQQQPVGKSTLVVKKPIQRANIKLDHDYCNPKKTAGPAGSGNGPRKAIEIPFLLPAKEQIREQKRLRKEKKSNDERKQQKRKEVAEDATDADRDISRHDLDRSNVNSSRNQLRAPVALDVIRPVVVADTPATVNCPPRKQISLLKVNYNSANAPEVAAKISEPIVGVQSEHPNNCWTAATAEPHDVTECCEVKVRKKLNLMEYKKRRDGVPIEGGLSKAQAASEDQSSGGGRAAMLTNVPHQKVVPVSTVQPKTVPAATTSLLLTTMAKTVDKVNMPLDPILAAKMKALRMQQLKKEAAIKSTEAKINRQTVPLMPIVPLAEITSLEFDEQGNPLPLDRQKKDIHPLKLHDDYEEIIIVSMGCNTDIHIGPKDIVQELDPEQSAPSKAEKTIPKNELLLDINDTMERCQSSAIMSGSSLISSIRQVVIKKTSGNVTEHAAVPKEHTTMQGGQMVLQTSPNIGISPPNAFSPGKPEKANTFEQQQQSPDPDYDEPLVTQQHSVTQQSQQKQQQQILEHGEDKIIMHLRKDRVRAKGESIATQTTPLERFPQLRLLSPVSEVRHKVSGSKQQSPSERRNRNPVQRQYRRRHDSDSSMESECRPRSSNSYRSGSKRSCSPRVFSRRSRSRGSSRNRSRSRSGYRNSRSHSGRRKSITPEHRWRTDSRRYSRRRRSSSTSSDSSGSSSRSRSWTRSRSRTPIRRMKIDTRQHVSPERKIVYVGRLEHSLKKEDLMRKFALYGRIRQVTMHCKESGARYGFVTFEKPQDAYSAIDASMKDPNLSKYDISFGGRRAFCRTQYADLDGDLSIDQEAIIPYVASDGCLIMTPAPYNPLTARKVDGDSFESMLKKLKQEISAKKPRKT